MVILLSLALLSSGVYDYTPITRNLDPGYVPDTREDYLSSRPPYVPLEVTPVSGEARGTQFLVVLTESVADSLAPGLLDQWMADIQAEGLTVSAVELTWSSPEEIRAWLSGLHSEGLEGVVLVGDVPSAWAALEDYADERSNETFPTDYFYWDLDGDWTDAWTGYPSGGVPGPDGIYDGWSGDLFPEIYVGRILTHVILNGNQYQLLNDYLTRLHQWRLEGDPDPHALCYVDDDWSGWGVGYRNSMKLLYTEVELVSQVDSTNGTDYRQNRLPAGYTWISPFVHSGPTVHQWSPGPSTTSGHIWTDQPPSRFYNLFACSNARFTSNWCMGCVYVFGTQTGLAAVGSTKSGAMLQFNQFYGPLGQGDTFGTAMFKWWEYIQQGGFSQVEMYWHLGMTILGDPTIVPAMHFLSVEGTPAPTPLLLIGPNPVSGAAAVNITGTGLISVFDISGRRIAEGFSSLNLAGLAPGVYLVRAESGAESVTGRFTVVR
jgi:hypothetical protein